MTFTRKPIFWISFIAISIACIMFTIKFFSTAFPIVNLEITADRATVMQQAQELAKQHQWGPAEYKQAASFETDTLVKTFVELEAGGKKAFANMLTEPYYAPYIWQVRHFKEHHVNETYIYFTPQGEPYGFQETIAEEAPGAALGVEVARALAEKEAHTIWHINRADYKLIESTKEIKPNKRADHTFTYERREVRIGDGFYRLKLVVTGDKLTELSHSVFVPANFVMRYKEMRSSNDSIATAASLAYIILYMFGGCIGGLAFLTLRRWIVWQPALRWGLFIAFAGLLTMINQLPLLWMRYDTALSTTTFLTHLFIQFFFSFIAQLFFVTTIFTVAESLTRKAFGNHPQLWRVWEPAAASSYQILGRTVGGYLMVSIHLAFAVGLYFLTTSLFGWWTPSEELFNPNILAHYWPWLSPLSSSLSAGFVEECLFRAVPLACAALIGKKYGKLGWWLMGTMILQAVIFGAAHANYPAFPAYARIVELIMPSFFFGGVYLVFGLLPSIIAHYVYDVVWFALPIFISSAPGAILNKSFIILGVAVPLIMVIYARLRVGAWHTLAASFYNKAWSPVPHIETVKHEPAPRQQHQLTKGTKRFILAAGIVGFAVWFLVSPKKDNAQRLNINRANAIAMAKQEVAQHGTPIDASWRTLSSIVLTNKSVADRMLEHRFIWQHDTDAYKKLMAHSFLQAPYWYIRFIKINGTIDERAEEYNVHIHDDGVIRTIHQLAESLPGAQLSQQQAREKAYETLEKKFNLPQKYLHEISAQAIKMPARQDWLFVFQNSQQQLPAQSQARVGVYVAGDIVTDASRFVYVPEQWQRDEQSGLSRLSTLTSICLFLMLIFIILGIRVMQQHLVLSKMFVLISFVVFLVFTVLAFINGWPTTIAHFSPILPWSHQLFSTIGFMCILAIIFTVMLTYIFSLIMSYRNHSGLAKTLSNQFLGLAIGFVVAAALIVVQRMVPSLEPLWADYEPLANYCPIFAIITKNLTGYLLSSSVIYIILIGLDYYVRMNKWYRILFVVVGLTLAAKLAIGSVASWLTIGLALGILLLAAYEYLLKYDLALTFVAVGAYSITQVAQQIIFNAIPAAPLGGIISCIFIGALASYFFKKL